MKHVKLMKADSFGNEDQVLPETDVNSIIGLDLRLKAFDQRLKNVENQLKQLNRDKNR